MKISAKKVFCLIIVSLLVFNLLFGIVMPYGFGSAYAEGMAPPAAPNFQCLSTGDGYIEVMLQDTVNNLTEIDKYEVVYYLFGTTDKTVLDHFPSQLDEAKKVSGTLYDFVTGDIYCFYAVAIDKAGNRSAQSSTIYEKVGAGPVTPPSPPTKPGNVHAVNVTAHTAEIAWNASTAAEGILKYNIYRNGTWLAEISATSYNDINLTEETAYEYTVEAVVNNIQVGSRTLQLKSELSDVLHVTTLDGTPPVIADSYPRVETVTGSAVTFQVKVNEAGKAYYVCLENDSTTPSALQIIEGKNSSGDVLPSNLKGQITVEGDVETSATIEGLKAMTDYYIFIVAADSSGNHQASPAGLYITTSEDNAPPVNASGYPRSGGATAGSVSVVMKTDEYGKIFYVCLANGATAPKFSHVRAGVDAAHADLAANLKGSIDMIGDSENTFTISGLASSTDYDVYVVAEDVNGRLQEAAAKVDVRTSSSSSGGSSGGGNGGGATPPPAVQPSQTEPKNGSMAVKPADNGSGTAAAKVGTEELGKAFEQVAAGSDGIKTATVILDKVEGVDGYALQLPAGFLSSGNDDMILEIVSPLGKIAVPSNMFDLQNVAGAASVELSIGVADTSGLSEDLLKSIGNKPVIELSASVDGKPFSWKSDNAQVTVAIDYTPTADELKDPEHIVVWYIDGSGNVTSVPNGRYDTATGKVIFSTDHFSKYAVTYVTKTFEDISNSFAKKKIEVMASKGIISGTSTTAYSPDSQITRADFISLLVRTLNLKAKFDVNFSDIKATDNYYNAVGIAKKLGITSGTGKNLFKPNEKITRQDMAALTYKALMIADNKDFKDANKLLPKITDAKSISSYAEVSVAVLVNKSIISISGNSFKPKELVTRAEMADIIYNIYHVIYK